MADKCTFSNDNNVVISLLNHPLSSVFASRENHEALFRRIHTFLINRGYIQGNIIDLGAWIGDNTVPWAKNIDSKNIDSKNIDVKNIDTKNIVYAIDPSPNNCDFIRQTCELNGITNVEVIQTAISDKNEVLTTSDDLYHCSFLSEGSNKVAAVTLDHLFLNKQVKDVGYIHLDVEGLEYRVILGANKLIDTMRPIIAFEQHLETDNVMELVDHMIYNKYVVFMIDEILPGCRTDCRNFLSFPIEKFDDKMVDELNAFIGREVFVL
jgi:FkbM family methyltransferase